MLKIVLIVILAAAAAQAKHLPAGVTTCKRTDSECVAKAGTASLGILKNGNKDLGLPSLDPLAVQSIHIPGSGGNIDLEQTYTDVKVFGLSKMEFTSIKLNLDGPNCDIHAISIAPVASLVANLQIKGKLLLFAIGGSGRSNFTIYDLGIKYTYICEKFTKDGEEYIKGKETHITLTPKKLTYDMPGITPNAELSNNVISVMNENDLDVFAELKTVYESTFNQLISTLIDIVFTQIPLHETFLE